MADAEDAVQEVFEKWLPIDTSKVENTKAYLIRMITNSCLNVLQSKKLKEDTSIELSEELVDNENERFIDKFDFENQLQDAWNFLHRKLEPMERAVFVLREVFDVDYQDLQIIVDKKADNCRKILSRAKEKLQKKELPKINISVQDIRPLERFKAACERGNISQLVQDFTADFFLKKK